MGAPFSEQDGKLKAGTRRPSSDITVLNIVKHNTMKSTRGNTFPLGSHFDFENRGMIMTVVSKARRAARNGNMIEWLCDSAGSCRGMVFESKYSHGYLTRIYT